MVRLKSNQLAKLRGTSWGNGWEPVGVTERNQLAKLKRNHIGETEGNQLVKLKRNRLGKPKRN